MGYTLTFYDRAATPRQYQLLIDGGGTAIEGSGDAFETTEDADSDMFTPIRHQTGFFRWIGKNDHATWLAMIPADSLSKTVKLKRGNTVLWQGYIQPQVYDNDYPGLGTVEHEMSVQCPLSVLESIDIDTNLNSHPIVTFGQLLQTYIFGTLTGTTITGYYIQGSKAVTESRLALKCMWANFLTTDSNGATKAKYTCSQVLEEFCKLFGYTCRMHGQYIYFTQPTGNSQGFTYFTSLTGTGTYAARGSFSVTGAMIANTNNHEELHPGIGSVTVKSDINEIGNLLEIPYDELFDKYNVGLPSSPIIIRSVDWYEHNVYNLIRQPDANNSHMTYENENVSLDCYMANKPGTGTGAGNEKKYCRFFVYDDSDVGGDLTTQAIPQSKENFGWRKCIELFHSYNYTGSNSTPMFTISSKQIFIISDGYLYIDFKCHQVSAWIVDLRAATPPLKPYATARLKIGNKYWNGSAWTTTSSTFNLPFDESGARTNRTSPTDPQYNGFGIPVPDTLQGTVEFTIVDVPNWNFSYGGEGQLSINGFLPMMDFQIGFVRGTIEETRHNGNEYTATGGSFKDTVNVDLIFASDVTYGPSGYQRHMKAGVGYILGSNNKPVGTTLAMDGSSVIPEQELARIIADYGTTTHRMVKMDLRNSLLGDIVPTAISSGLESGLFPLAISHNWRDDITTITLMQI